MTGTCAHNRIADVRHLVAVGMLAALLSAAAAIAGAALGLTRAASAHDWYPAACCHGTENGGDCAPIAAARVKETPAGYVVDGKLTKPYGETQWSPDGRYHACFSKYTGELRCFWAPEKGSFLNSPSPSGHSTPASAPVGETKASLRVGTANIHFGGQGWRGRADQFHTHGAA